MNGARLGLGVAAALATLPVAAARIDDPDDLIRGRWFATEVIIFERAVSDEPGPEELMREGGRAWPANLSTYVEPRPWRAADLDPMTRACLEFPRLEVAPSTTPPPQSTDDELVEGDALDVMSDPGPGVSGNADAASAQASGFDATDWEPHLGPPEGSVRLEPLPMVPPPPIRPRLAPHPLLNLLSVAARRQEALRRDSYRWLPPETHALKAEARRLGNAPGLDVIWHGRWMQPVPDRSSGEPLMLAAQPAPGGGQLTGTLQVTVGRYLHFAAELWLEQSPHNPAATIPYMQFKQSRTMRSGELHYLDHPKMGVLVRIDPIPPSPALVQALRAWMASD